MTDTSESAAPPEAPAAGSLPRAAQLIHDGFVAYNTDFQRITDRAQRRFEQRDWDGHLRDIGERIELYEHWVQHTLDGLRDTLDDDVARRAVWQRLRDYFSERVDGVPDAGFLKTFFNSVTRRLLGTVGVDASVEFVHPPAEESVQSLVMRRYPCWDDIQASCRRILEDFRMDVPYADIDQCAAGMAAEACAYLRREHIDPGQVLRFEPIDSHFFQGTRAYLVGRVRHGRGTTPLMTALRNDGDGIRVDAVLMQRRQISVAFSYTRSCYFADASR